MANSAAPKPAGEVTFACGTCKVDGKVYTFVAAPERVDDAPDEEHHPWIYFAPCPSCARECGQAPWQRALFKAWVNATGPKTEEGKKKSSANGKGHPTAEEARRTRFNAMKHGLDARVATYFPAKPDGYSFCKGCEVDREWCAKQPACVKRAETFLLHHAAFDQRKPEILKELHADMHAAIFSVLQQILQTIMVDGVSLKAPVWYSDKDGGLHFVSNGKVDDEGNAVEGDVIGAPQLYDISAHPLLKSLAELLKATGLSLSDLGQTVKVLEGGDDEEMGRLAGTKLAPEAIDDFTKRQHEQLGALRTLVERARLRTDADPVLLEHNRESGVYEVKG